MSKEKKITKWDLKAAAKLVGLEWNAETEAKINELRGVAPAAPTTFEEVEELIKDTEPSEEVQSKSLIALAVVQVNKDFLVVKVPFNLEDAQVIKKVDNEARAVLERDRAEAETKKDEYKRRR